MSYRDDLDAALARIDALEVELASRDDVVTDHERGWQVERAELLAQLEAARASNARVHSELAQARAECDRHVARIQVLQDERSRHAAHAPTTPTILDRGAKPICPHCLATGRERRLAVDRELTPSICPECARVTLLRGR